MVKTKFKQNRLIWVIAILFVFSIWPGQGEKIPDDPQAIAQSTFECQQDSDCPKCLGSGLAGFNECSDDAFTTEVTCEDAGFEWSGESFLGEFSVSDCIIQDNGTTGFCDLSEFCVVWSCGDTQPTCSEEPIEGVSCCNSVKQTVLDNTIIKIQDNPLIFVGAIGVILAFIFL